MRAQNLNYKQCWERENTCIWQQSYVISMDIEKE